MSGLRRDEAPTRANAPIVGFDDRPRPREGEPDRDLDRRRRRRLRGRPRPARAPAARPGLPVDRLLAVHQAGGDGDDPRAGRWAGSGKLECGLHGWTPSPTADRALSVHEVARSGFGAEAEAYERARPSYPPDAVAWLVERAGHLARSRRRRRRGRHRQVHAPARADGRVARGGRAGRGDAARDSPACRRRAAAAEALPFADGSLDAITVAQAFHWFDAAGALAEFHRVLRPGGRLGLIWNARDRSVPWVDQVWSIMDRVEKRAPWRAPRRVA